MNTKAEGRPEGFRPSKRAVQKILDAFKNPETLKKVKKLFKDNNIPWTFDTAKASTEVQSQPQSTDCRSNADRIYDADLSEEYYVNSIFHMVQITAPKGDGLLDRWIVDPGSNVHICNSTYFNWVKTSDATSTDVIFAGTSAHQITAWGEVMVKVDQGGCQDVCLLGPLDMCGLFAGG